MELILEAPIDNRMPVRIEAVHSLIAVTFVTVDGAAFRNMRYHIPESGKSAEENKQTKLEAISNNYEMLLVTDVDGEIHFEKITQAEWRHQRDETFKKKQKEVQA